MRVTIIPEDGFVSIDGTGYLGLDLSFMPADVHAVQWYGDGGDVERTDFRGRIIANEPISSLGPYQKAIDAWHAAREVALLEVEQPQEGVANAQLIADNLEK
jgi:hypothetical protein